MPLSSQQQVWQIKQMVSFLISVFVTSAFAQPLCAPSHDNDVFMQLFTTIVVPFRKMCEDIRNIEVGKPPKHQPLCAAFWTEGQPTPFEKRLKSDPESLNKQSEKAMLYTGEQMKEMGQELVSDKTLKEIGKAFVNFKTKLAAGCCGNDVVCRNAFAAVALEFCESPKDPKIPDPCATIAEANYKLDDSDLIKAWVNLNSRKPVYEENDLQIIQETDKNELNKAMSARGTIASGYVILSKYFLLGTPRGSFLLQHELGHACSQIRRQISALKNEAESSEGDVMFSDMEKRCAKKKTAYSNFSFLTEFDGKAAVDQIVSCIHDRIQKEMYDKSDLAYAPNGCYQSKVEEAAGDMFAALSSLDGTPNTVSMQCQNYPDAQHIGGFSVVGCLAAHSASYREKIKKGFQCSKRHSFF